MKKVVIALAITAFAVVTQAASLNWSMAAKVATESPTGSSSAGRASFYTAMVFLASDSAAVTKALNSGDIATVESLTKSTFQATKTGQFAGLINDLEGDTASIFAVVFDTQNAGDALKDAIYYQITGIVTAKTYSGTDAPSTAVFSSAEVSNSYSKIGAGGGGDVPEPTSGLLLLLGAAGLALRRKQK